MAITFDGDRQWPLVARVAVDYTMLTDGVAVEAVELPAGAVVVDVKFLVTTVWNSATSDTLDIGDGGDVDRYTASAPIDITALGDISGTNVSGFEYTSHDTIDLIWNGTGTAPTTGAGILYVLYYVDGKATEVQD